MARFSALIAVALALCLASGAAAQDAASLYRQGVDRQQSGDLAGAAESYRKVLNLDAENVAARSNLGAALVGLGRFDEAIPEYERALRGASEQVRPFLQKNVGLAYYKSGRLLDASDIFLALHKAQPANRDAALLAADCFLQLGEPARSLELLEPMAQEARRAAPGELDKTLAYLLGMTYLKSGKAAEAQRVLDPVLRDTSTAEGNYALGLAMFTAGDFPAAMEALSRAAQMNPALPRLFSWYGQALVFTGDPDGALEAFARQLSADRNDFEANFESALILNRRRKFVEAEPLLRRAVLLRPRSAAAHLALGVAFSGEKNVVDARAELERTVDEWPEFGEAHARLADVYTGLKLSADAARETSLAARFRPPVQQPAQPGPPPGSMAPPIRLPRADGVGSVSLQSPTPGKPTVLIFGSYTCPNFRRAAAALNEFSKLYGARAAFLLVYIREAHATGTWQSTINRREHVELAPPASLNQKHNYAALCVRRLHLSFPAVTDGMDDAAEQAYAAWPSRVYVVSTAGRVLYSSALIEEEFDRDALEAAIRGSLPKAGAAY